MRQFDRLSTFKFGDLGYFVVPLLNSWGVGLWLID